MFTEDRPSSVASCQGVSPAYSLDGLGLEGLLHGRSGPMSEAARRKWPSQVNQLGPAPGSTGYIYPGSIRNSAVSFNVRSTPYIPPSVHVRNGIEEYEGNSMRIQQVWPLTQFFFCFLFCKKSLVCLEGKSMTPSRRNTILFRSSQQLPRLRLGPLKGFLS